VHKSTTLLHLVATYGRDSMALHILKSEADMDFKVDIVYFSTPSNTGGI
jgi:hypothetical protein